MNAPRNIAIIGPAWPLRGGGMSTFNERMALAFQEAGHNVKIYTFSLQYPAILFPGKTQYSVEPAPQGLDIESCINSINPLNWLLQGRRIAAARHDLVIIRFWIPFMGACLGTLAKLIRQNMHTKVLVLADNVIPHESRMADRWLTQYLFSAPDGIVTLSQFVDRQLPRFTSKPSRVLDHPLYDNFGSPENQSAARLKLGLPEKGILLLFFGFIRHYKGLDLLLEAFARLAPRYPDTYLLVAGEFYEKPEKYKALQEHPALKMQLILRNDFVENKEVKWYFSAADYVIQPYRNATQSGVTPLAYHFEKPMLVTSVGALPDMVPHGVAGLVSAPNADSIEKTLEQLINESPGKFISGIQAQKKLYSWERFGRNLLSFADQL